MECEVIEMAIGERIHGLMCRWRDAAEKLESGEISREVYDDWRYNFRSFE